MPNESKEGNSIGLNLRKIEIHLALCGGFDPRYKKFWGAESSILLQACRVFRVKDTYLLTI